MQLQKIRYLFLFCAIILTFLFECGGPINGIRGRDNQRGFCDCVYDVIDKKYKAAKWYDYLFRPHRVYLYGRCSGQSYGECCDDRNYNWKNDQTRNCDGSVTTDKSIKITSPENGAEFNLGDNINVTAELKGYPSDTKVRFDYFIDFTNKYSITADASPFTASWKAPVPTDACSITATAVDKDGNSSISESNEITVKIKGSGNSPYIQIQNPPFDPNNKLQIQISQSINFKARVTDDDLDATKVKFYVNDIELTSVTKDGDTFSKVWSSSGKAVNTYNFTVKATDLKNNTSTLSQKFELVAGTACSQTVPANAGTSSISSFVDKSSSNIINGSVDIAEKVPATFNVNVTNGTNANVAIQNVCIAIICDNANDKHRLLYGTSSIVREIKVPYVSGTSSYALTWDGKDSKTPSQYLLPGTYTAHSYLEIKANGSCPYVTGLSSDISFTVTNSKTESQSAKIVSSYDRLVNAEVVVPTSAKSATLEVSLSLDGKTWTRGSGCDLKGTKYYIHENVNNIFSESQLSNLISEFDNTTTRSQYYDFLNQDLLIYKDDAFASNSKYHVLTVFDKPDKFSTSYGLVRLTLTLDGKVYESYLSLVPNSTYSDFIDDLYQSINTYWPGNTSGTVLAKRADAFEGMVKLHLFLMACAFSHWMDKPVAVISSITCFFPGFGEGFSKSYQDFLTGFASIKQLVDIKTYQALFSAEFAYFLHHIIWETGPDDLCISVDKFLTPMRSEADKISIWKTPAGVHQCGDRYIEGYVTGYCAVLCISDFALAGILSGSGRVLKSALDVLETQASKVLEVYAAMTTDRKATLRLLDQLAKHYRTGLTKELAASTLEKIRSIKNKLASEKLDGKSYLERFGTNHKDFSVSMEELYKSAQNIGKIDVLETVIKRTVQIEKTLGSALSEDAFAGLCKLYKNLMDSDAKSFMNQINSSLNATVTITDPNTFFDDLIKVFTKTDGTIHKQAIDESLVDFLKNTSTAPQLKIKRFSEIYGTESYRFLESEGKCVLGDKTLTYEEYIKVHKKLPATGSGYDAPQFGPQKYSSPAEAADYLQIKTTGDIPDPIDPSPSQRWSDFKLRITVSNAELNDNVSASFSRKNVFKTWNEPCCRTYPEYGRGSGIQYECRIEINILKLEKWNGTEWVNVPF